MANIKSAKRRIKITKVKTANNRLWKQKIRSATKSFEISLATKKVGSKYKNLQTIIDKAAIKNVIHKRKAARLKSKLTKMIQ